MPGNGGVGKAVTGQTEDVALAFGERVGLRPGFGGESGIDGAASGVDSANGTRQFGGRRVFQQIAGDACFECPAKIAGSGKRGENDDAGARHGPAVDRGGER